jgi:hypothetical protein
LKMKGKVFQYDMPVNPEKHSIKVMFGIPTTGLIRFEWHAAFNQLIIPTNWSHSAHVNVHSPVGHQVAEARNDCVKAALAAGFDWLFFIDHDVLLPPDTCIKMRDHMLKAETPVLGGLYYTKSSTPEPLLFRGRGNGPFYDWRPGEKVWVDGLPMGLTMLHTSLFRAMKPPWFVTPREMRIDDDGNFVKASGTEDLYFFDRVIDEDVLERSGWGETAKREYPWLCDTSMFGAHIDVGSGSQYPHCMGDEYMRNHDLYYEGIQKSKEQKKAQARRLKQQKARRGK